MSMMKCSGCDRIEDTDDCTGHFEFNGIRFWCERCVEEAFEDHDPQNPIMLSMLAENPKEFQETWESYDA